MGKTHGNEDQQMMILYDPKGVELILTFYFMEFVIPLSKPSLLPVSCLRQFLDSLT
ncbi:hypothetical protein [Algoriphagus sp. CAU 1675]|uniref:hypothetical protein n=1 Tax=Algoriphagus sp. CAU 1675 TaxID=3032597 RepID=UPI0023DB0E13|nr:hypothetical protein [Algoriphagus sp. CAU 1675]MDF2158028.1 hypothetical protein [Algoriphagus sp. CAU 1675]